MQFSIKSLKLDSSSSIAWRAQIQSKECFRQRNFALLNNSLLPPAADEICSGRNIFSYFQYIIFKVVRNCILFLLKDDLFELYLI